MELLFASVGDEMCSARRAKRAVLVLPFEGGDHHIAPRIDV